MIKKDEHNKETEQLALDIFDTGKNIQEEQVNSVTENEDLRHELQLLDDVRSIYLKDHGTELNIEQKLTDFHRKHDNSRMKSILTFHGMVIIGTVAAILIGCIFYLFYNHALLEQKTLASVDKPGQLHATTEDGQEITVDRTNNHTASISMTDIRKNIPDQSSTESVLFTVPSGKSLDLELPDGSMAYIHASSVVVFPTSFTGKRREIRIEKGEVYFKVHHDPKHPFVVNANGVETVALGTEFDVNIHSSGTEVTLITGSVSVSTGTSKKTLIPNQQASCSRSDINVTNVDVASYKFWSEGYYFFDDKELQTIISTLASEYSMKTEYLDTTHLHTKMHFITERNGTIDDAIDLLNRTKKVHIQRDGNTITVK